MTVEVKICGLSTPGTVEGSIAAGADYIGLNFYPASPRYVSLERAAELSDIARGRVKIVALVVDAGDGQLADIVGRVNPDFIQAHGLETPERIGEIGRLTGKPVIKAIRVRDVADIAAAAAFAEVASLILYDAKAPETLSDALPGGNGHAFDWGLLGSEQRPAFMLAGGLTRENVAQAIRVTGAPVVDLSSGVESAPGIKDIGLIRKFIEAAKSGR
ncbi:phosphoribosylanthranilate isomerase [Aestuariivirga sp.]|uniref:phosphoribosylanthranilate isomerase n=1 Tax=Aestuariivirga sp. TaxID=2650926 RepID=UPI0025B811D3|nr:phosphoribosylanthranilate isomerase [Aestuariivirga sp.]MCA3556421.1 phosphoribosylanthranilate isomerase [Aestuariivirga sp.]